MNVYSLDSYLDNDDSDRQNIIESNQSVVEMVLRNEDPIYLQLKPFNGPQSMNNIGYYEKPGSPFGFCVLPKTDEDKNIYQPEPNSGAIISLNPENMNQYLTEAEKNKDRDAEALERCESDGRYIPPILQNDSPEMRALKECIIQKDIDLDKYSERFGVNYPNDKRKLKDSEITSFLLKRYCTNLDIEVDMVFRDKDDKVPNAMNKEIRINLVPGNGNNVTIISK